MSKRLSGEQKAFNAAVRHLRKQGKKAKGGNNQPYYVYMSNADNSRCAIGGIIPMKMLSMKLTGGVSYLFKERVDIKKYLDRKFGKLTEKFYSDLQIIHDKHETRDWENEFIIFANKYGLKIPK